MEQLIKEIERLKAELEEKDKKIAKLEEVIEEQWDRMERRMKEKDRRIQEYSDELDYIYNQQKRERERYYGNYF